jgi:hypothetical protein
MVVINGKPALAMRHLDNTTHTVSVLDESVALADVTNAVIDVANRARAWRDKRNPLRRGLEATEH